MPVTGVLTGTRAAVCLCVCSSLASSFRRRAIARVAMMIVLAGLVPTLARAASVTLAWDANTEPDLAGYVVRYRAQDGSHSGSVNVGHVTTAVISHLRGGGRTYFFSVSAYNAMGVTSEPSAEVSAQTTGPDDVPTDGGTGGGTDGGEPFSGPTEARYFAEGATGAFQYRLALVNTQSQAAAVTVSFLREGAEPITRSYDIAGQSRATVLANDIPELQSTSFAAMVQAPATVFAERTMSWNMGGLETGAHTAKNLLAPAQTWYLAEGNAGFFDTFVLLANPTDAVVAANVSFLLDDGVVVARQYDLQPRQRLTVYTNEIPELLYRSFATTVNAASPILVERAMYFRARPDGMFSGGHASAAVAEAAPRWFLAEGQTGSFFDTFVLISNPQSAPVDATIRYLTPAGEARVETLTLAPTSRTTIEVDHLPGLEATDVSFDITATAPIIVERSMYWSGDGWKEASNVTGITELGTAWVFAEGEVGGPDAAESYFLLVNPGSSAASVTITFLREGGAAPITVTRTVAPNARETVSASSAGLESGERFGALVSSDQPIAAERAIYSSPGGVFWGSGTAETGTRLQ